MDLDENNVAEEQQDNGEQVEIYSRRAIWWFSFLSPVVGSVMLAVNLFNVGYKKAIIGVLTFAVLYYVVTAYAILKFADYLKLPPVISPADLQKLDMATQMKYSQVAFTLIGVHIVGATILTRVFFKRYFPEEDYFPKSIAIPLVITIILILLNVGGAGF